MRMEPLEQDEEPRRQRPVLVKLRLDDKTGPPRLSGCPAWPQAGIYAGASLEWCRANRGKLAACAGCRWATA